MYRDSNLSTDHTNIWKNIDSLNGSVWTNIDYLNKLRQLFATTGFAEVISENLNNLYNAQSVFTCCIQPYNRNAEYKPNNGEGLCISSKNSENNYGSQLVISDSGVYYRKIYQGSFQSWQKII